MAETERGSTPQAGVIIGSLIAVVLLVIGLWVGFADRTPVMCGSVLGGSSRYLSDSDVLRCDRALSAATTWTWLLIVLAVVAFVIGLLITIYAKMNEQRRSAAA